MRGWVGGYLDAGIVGASSLLGFRHKKRRLWTSLDDEMVGRGNLKQVGIYLFFWLIIYWSTCLEYQLERYVVWIPMDGAF